MHSSQGAEERRAGQGRGKEGRIGPGEEEEKRGQMLGEARRRGLCVCWGVSGEDTQESLRSKFHSRSECHQNTTLDFSPLWIVRWAAANI